MDKVIHYTKHALNRMESRNISVDKVEQILNAGQVFSADSGCHRAKLQEFTGKNIIRHEIVFCKSENRIISVWKSIKPFSCRTEGFQRIMNKEFINCVKKPCVKEISIPIAGKSTEITIFSSRHKTRYNCKTVSA